MKAKMERSLIRGLRAAGVLLAAVESVGFFREFSPLSSTSTDILKDVIEGERDCQHQK